MKSLHFLFIAVILLCAIPANAQAPSSAEDFQALTQPYSASQCSPCASWSEPQEPFRVHGNTYYVGTKALSSVLITSPEGHILIDGTLPGLAPEILESVRTLGFEPADIKLILNSHAHFDHAGGIAALQHFSGARVAASPASAEALERGSGSPDDPQYGALLDYPPVADVQRLQLGETLQIGSIEITSHATGGHSPGGTSWSWRSCEDDQCIDVVYADSLTPVSADGFLFTDPATYPDALADFEQAFQTLEQLPCDLLITTHPSASALWDRWQKEGDSLIDPKACAEYVDAARLRLAKRMETEKSSKKEKAHLLKH